MLGTDCYYTDSNGTVDMTSVMNMTERLTVRTKRIDAVDVNISVPVVGNHPQDASSNTYNVNVTKTAWSCNDVEISAPNTFDAGNTYQVHVEVQASNDCTFADSPTITIR